MKYVKYVVLVVALVAAFNAAPARAASETTLPFAGTLYVGNGLSYNANTVANATCVSPSVSTQPSAGADVCTLSWSGVARPTAGAGTNPAAACAAWTAAVSGTALANIRLLPSPQYRLSLTVTQAFGALVITGTATDLATGAVKSVSGSGALHSNDPATCATHNGATVYLLVGSLTIAG